ncbi:glycosyltransferase family 4 protein [Mesonia sp. MT50]|uniref:Glycosyltransferase family 4 protein n=1 Tax=Mesonia profundi TaxID=3070998 RepID=A0ABU0ZYQ0_9FLAO|nr:glycosyltransferase family 4 protein [Mesonia profundi]MDQ7916542.1 glycosyltransferase family 4 protein [Mesonia profundi]
MKIKLLSNMYPSQKDLLFGIFVKKTVLALEENGAEFTQKIVIKGKRSSSFQKLLTYTTYYLKAVFSVFHREHELVYIHFLTHNLPLISWYNLFQKKPIVINLHGSDISAVKQNSWIDKYQAKMLKKAAEVVVPSQYFKAIVQERYPDINIPFYVYPSGGIDTTIFYPELSKRKSLSISFVSRIDKGKGWRDFLSIFSELNTNGTKIHATIAGDGAEKESFLEAIKNHSYNHLIDYRGFQSKEQLAEIYQSSELFIFPTQLPESLGLVGIEAMACQNVVFARNIGGPTGYVESGENGFLFNSVPEAVQQIKKYLALPKESKEIIQHKAFATAKPYEAQQVASNLYANFKTLCSTS